MGPSTRRDLKAVYRLVNQADLVLALIHKPDSSISSARESLTAALALTKDLVDRSVPKPVESNAAAELGAKEVSRNNLTSIQSFLEWIS